MTNILVDNYFLLQTAWVGVTVSIMKLQEFPAFVRFADFELLTMK